MENNETQVWLEFALKCGYMDDETYNNLTTKSEEIGKILSFMLSNPQKFL